MVDFRSIRISMLPYKYRLQKSYQIAINLIKHFGSNLVKDVKDIKTEKDKLFVSTKYNIKDNIIDIIMDILQLSQL